MPVGKPAPPRPRRPDFATSSTMPAGVERQRPLQPLVAAVRAIGVERQRIDDAAAGEGQPRLAREVADLLDRSERLGMTLQRPTARRAGPASPDPQHPPARSARSRGARRRSRPRPAAPATACRASRCGRSRSRGRRRRGLRERSGDLIGADSDGGRILRNEDAHRHAPAPFSSASSLGAVSRPTTCRPASPTARWRTGRGSRPAPA